MSIRSDYENKKKWRDELNYDPAISNERLNQTENSCNDFIPCPAGAISFRLDRYSLYVAKAKQDRLNENLNDTDALVFPMPIISLHITLCDIFPREMRENSDADTISDSLNKAVSLIERIRNDSSDRKIAFAADRVVLTESGAIIQFLRPKTKQDEELLFTFRELFGSIRGVSFPQMPYIKIAYLQTGTSDPDMLEEAIALIQTNPPKEQVFELDLMALTAQQAIDARHYIDIPVRFLFCCDGGLFRSVFASHIMTYLARKKKLPIVAEARAAYTNTQGWAVSEDLFETLEKHGISSDRSYSTARYLMDDEYCHFTFFAELTTAAMLRFDMMGLPAERRSFVSNYFREIKDPAYEGITLEQAFRQLYDMAEVFLDQFELEYMKRIK